MAAIEALIHPSFRDGVVVSSATNAGVDYCYDAVGRLLYETSYGRRLAFQYDAASNRTRITHPDSTYFQYTYDALNRVDQIQLNGSPSGANLIADYAYDAMSRRTSLARGNGVTTGYTYTQASRLATLTHDIAGTSHDATWSFGYTAAGQLSSRTLVEMYEWPVNARDEDYVANGLNQYTNVEGSAFNYDARGNLISDGSRNFAYDLENRLLTASGAVSGTLSYDPLGRLRSYATGGTTIEFLYDGDRLVAEYVSGSVARRYAHGPGVDEPLVWYEGAGTSDPRWLATDRQGSIVAATDATGAAIQTYTYGPYGEPNAWSGARFRYTGQAVLAELQLYHYKARVYDPLLGRFLQTDPVGYGSDLNPYAYVLGDPITFIDPEGTLQRDANGRLIFRRRGRPYEERHQGAPTRRFLVQPGYLLANDGRRIEALRNQSRYSGFNCNCHGLTFADGEYWINNDQVDSLLAGDGYERVQEPSVGDVAVYRNTAGDVVHSGTVVGVDDESGEATIFSEGGLETEPHVNPATPGPGGAWSDPAASLEFYRLPEEIEEPPPTGTRLRREQ